MGKYFPPKDKAKQFNCIHCGVFAKQYWGALLYQANAMSFSPVTWCKCEHCNQISYWHAGSMIIPAEAPVPPHHPDMPASVSIDYDEARSIFARSPRAAVALLRLAVQKLMPELGESGRNINEDIKALVAKGLPLQVQQAFDFCRVVGNNAVHPGEINLSDTPEMGQNLFDMLNFIVEDRITRPRQIADLYAKLPEGARQAIEKRDA